MAQSITNPASKEKKEEKKRKWKDPNESIKFVCEKGKIMCPFCSVPTGKLKVTSNTLSLQDSPWMTTGDRNGKINLDFKGTCTHPSQKSPPCKAVINTSKWKNYSDVHIDNQYALIVKSTIPCLISGMDIRVVHSGQMALLTRINPLILKRLIIAPESNQILAVHVCHKLEYNAWYYENGEQKESSDIRWKVKIGEADEVKLEEVEEIIKKDCQLTGARIHFPVPQEWRYRKIILTAYLKNDEEVNDTGMDILIKDHIVAAFYRIKSKDAIPFKIHNVQKQPGSAHIYPDGKLIPPLYHLQGMYKEGRRFYFSGSTDPLSPAYVLMTDECADGDCIETGGYENYNVIRLNEKKISAYTHPGGIQVAGGYLVVGLEKYSIDKAYASTTTKSSWVCFYNVSDNELINEFDRKNDISSAAGIVCVNGEYIVAVRGNKESIEFYEIKKIRDKECSINKIENVGDFQNINLFKDDNECIYLFGMDKTGDGDVCKIYQVIFDNNKVERLKAVFIENGYMDNSKNYNETTKNKLIFKCTSGISFHWSSCLHIEKNENTGIEEDTRKEDPGFTGNIDTGFIGKFTVYASGQNVEDLPIKPENVKYTVRRVPSSPVIHCNKFSE